MSILGVDLYLSSLVFGLITGATYGLLALGIVLVYRSTNVINFAHGQLGALGAFALAKLVLDYDIPFVVGLPLVMAAGALLGALIEIGIIRRLSSSPRLMVLVATIGISQVLLVAQLLLPRIENSGGGYPVVIDREVHIGTTVVTGAGLLVLAVVPAVIVTLTYFLTKTPYGLMIQASAENRDAARLAQVRVKRVGTGVWALAGALAVLTSVLIQPVTNQANVNMISEGLGPSLLLRALVAAMIGRFVSLPLSFAGGLVVGVVEAVVLANFSTSPGSANAVLFVAVLLLLLVGGRLGSDDATRVDAAIIRVRPLPEQLQHIFWLRNLSRLGYLLILVLAVGAPVILTSTGDRFIITIMVIYPIICLSLTVLAGWAGQISLGQFAFVGVGAFAAGGLTLRGVELPVAVVMASLITAGVAVAVGLPTLRMRGLLVAIMTLALAVASHQWFFELSFVKGAVEVPQLVRPEWLVDNRAYYYFCLAFSVLTFGAVSLLQRSGSGRLVLAVRDNENAASALGINPRKVKIVTFAFAGGLAGLGGALLGGAYVRFGADDFSPTLSLTLVSMVIIGGLGLVSGAILGPTWLLGLPLLIGESTVVTIAVSGVGLLVFLLYVPQGLGSFPLALRSWLVERELARLKDREVAPAPIPRHVTPVDRPAATAGDAAVLQVINLRKEFLGRAVLQDICLEVRHDEIVGLIGANGAGKSTLLDIITGLTRSDAGTTLINGRDVSRDPAHVRAELGVGRTFQDARLFSSLSVQECLEVATELTERCEFVPDLFSLPPAIRASRARRAAADDLIGLLGLGRYRDAYVSELSTGTRRVVELACQLALRPKVMLLDEPTAGVAQRETERFGPLIRSIKAELGASVVIVEHDMPLVRSISDRMYCLGSGMVLAQGTPDEVIADPAVVAAYLGTDERAITRSGANAGSIDVERSERSHARSSRPDDGQVARARSTMGLT